MECNICGSREFVPGFNGRLAGGIPPMCGTCHSAERHRIIREIYSPLKQLVKDWRVLQFAPDSSIDRLWFKEYVGSSYGGHNSLDMMNIDLPDGSFDLVVSNHVLEHVRDDRLAIREMLRVVGPSGVVHLNVPTPTYRWETWDWGYADAQKNEHYRDYGADFPQQIVRDIPGLACAAVAAFDRATSVADLIYFFSRDQHKLGSLAEVWNRHAIPITRIF